LEVVSVKYRAFCLAALAGLLLASAPACDDDDCDLEVTTTVLPDGVEGERYFFDLDAKCGGDEWRLTDGSSLPPGIGLNEDGELHGTPTESGTFSFTVEVIEFHSFDFAERAFAGLSLTVRERGQARTPTPTPTP
jgi:hypothetical protein